MQQQMSSSCSAAVRHKILVRCCCTACCVPVRHKWVSSLSVIAPAARIATAAANCCCVRSQATTLHVFCCTRSKIEPRMSFGRLWGTRHARLAFETSKGSPDWSSCYCAARNKNVMVTTAKRSRIYFQVVYPQNVGAVAGTQQQTE